MTSPAAARAALLLIAACASLPAQQSTHFELDAGEVAVARLLELGSRQLHCSILINPSVLARLPAVVVAAPIRAAAKDDATAAFADLLYSAGLALIPADASLQLHEVVALNGQRGREIPGYAMWMSPEAVLKRPASKQVVATMVPLAHIDAAAAAQALRAQQPQTRTLPALTCGATVDNTALVLNGLQVEVATAIDVLQQLDRAAAKTPVKTAAEQLQQRLTALDQQVTDLEKQFAGLQPTKTGTDGK